MNVMGMLHENDVTPTADCSVCPHHEDSLKRGLCNPGDICVRAMSGRQITRFFSNNPELAEQYVGDRESEIRLAVAERIDSESLIPLLHDNDWRVRFSACRHAQLSDISPLLEDEDEDVRTLARERLTKQVE